MEQLIIEWQNLEVLMSYIVSFVLGIIAFFGYLKKAGIKLASVEKVLEYRQIKDSVGFIQKYISIAEIITIVKYVSEESEKINEITGKPKGLTGEIKEKAFEMFIDAMKTKEPGNT